MITVNVDWTPLAKYLDGVKRKQLAYATAVATTKLAQLAQVDVRGSLSSRFVIRSPWVSKGIKIERGEKRDWPAVQAIVGTVDWFMESQETGRERLPHAGKKNLSVPGEALRPRAAPSTKVPRAKWPGKLLKKGGKRRAFTQTLISGSRKGDVAVLRRDTSDRYPLQVLYVFQTRTKGKKRLGMHDTVTASVAQHYPVAFFSALEKALQPKGVRSTTR